MASHLAAQTATSTPSRAILQVAGTKRLLLELALKLLICVACRPGHTYLDLLADLTASILVSDRALFMEQACTGAASLSAFLQTPLCSIIGIIHEEFSARTICSGVLSSNNELCLLSGTTDRSLAKHMLPLIRFQMLAGRASQEVLVLDLYGLGLHVRAGTLYVFESARFYALGNAMLPC